MSAKPYSVMFVCTGNICRSPMAAAVFANRVKISGKESLFKEISSCALTDYHIGDDADLRTKAVCKKNGVPIRHAAKLLAKEDFTNYTHVIGMDNWHVTTLKKRKPTGATADISLFSSWNQEAKEIADPWYGPDSLFDDCYVQCKTYSDALLAALVAEAES